MGVASGCGEQEVGVTSGSGWNLWVWLLGVVVWRYIDFLTTYPYSSCICSFLQQHPYFLFIFFNVFRSCSSTFFKLHFRYLINNFFTQYKHIPETTGIPWHPYEGCTYVLYMKKHTQTYASYPAMDISCMSLV